MSAKPAFAGLERLTVPWQGCTRTRLPRSGAKSRSGGRKTWSRACASRPSLAVWLGGEPSASA